MSVLHNCDLAEGCHLCNVPFCPYEKLDDGSYSGWVDDDEDEYEEDEDEGW